MLGQGPVENSDAMGQKDLSEKILADYNDVFADIINVLVFKGEERVAKVELQLRIICNWCDSFCF